MEFIERVSSRRYEGEDFYLDRLFDYARIIRNW